jgi:cytochrome c oxidase subunit 6a
MTLLARNSFRALQRAAPRPRTFTAAAEHPALTKYIVEDKALRHHAAGQTQLFHVTILPYLVPPCLHRGF